MQSSNPNWQPGADQKVFRERAVLYEKIRRFFATLEVLEVVVPTLGRATVTDPAVESLGFQDDHGQWYLQTSPECFLKRMLAAGVGDLYHIGPVFRRGEAGRIHNPEFTLLEWYRCGYDHHQLMLEVAGLIDHCLGPAPVTTLSYRALLRQVWQQDILSLPPVRQSALASEVFGGEVPVPLEALYAEAITRYPQERFFVWGFPQEQAAMAALCTDADGHRVAARFECIIGGVEIANGYKELVDPVEQRNRFQEEQKKRLKNQQYIPKIDEKLLAALTSGLPDCAGVAVGLDRLLMMRLDAKSLDAVLSFSHDRL